MRHTSPRRSGSRRSATCICLTKGGNNFVRRSSLTRNALALFPPDTQLTPWPDGQAAFGGAKLQKWDTLSDDEKKLFIRQADVFAAYTAYTDHEIGRVIQAV